MYSRNGRARWYHLGLIHLSDARVLVSKLRFDIAQGKDPLAERQANLQQTTFTDLHQRYLTEHAQQRNKSWEQANYLVRKHLLPQWGKRDAKGIGRVDVRAMMGRIKAPITANQTLAAASAIFTWAMKEEILPVNPCKLVQRNETKSRERVLSESELPLMWDAFDDAELIVSTALKLILLLGQRPGEVAHMRYEHIKGGWWEMPGEPVPSPGWPGTKNGAAHRLWLPQPAQMLIAEIAEGDGSGFVFGRLRGLDRAMRMLCRKLAVQRLTPHDLRRTHGSTITALGFGRDAMNRIQNHREGGIASVYDRHSYAEENKRIMEAVANHFVALVEGRGGDNVVRARF